MSNIKKYIDLLIKINMFIIIEDKLFESGNDINKQKKLNLIISNKQNNMSELWYRLTDKERKAIRISLDEISFDKKFGIV
jgi:predicted DNA binding protein